MNHEEEIRNSAGTAKKLADKTNILRKSFLLTTAKINSVLITIGEQIDRTLKTKRGE
ncbi:hypothetical protein [Bacillus pumilus]|uniref:hypothetical protein n=1 Tax=Bacillus pumilus TaxID=1408 RepID=UPI00227EDE90|nr:hypothetical protein [Bacillus pumilus]MCY7572325.1 hypothetical protein [Bacillus pumilus]MEC3762016.1 hypothetical protein [Bacillus pumilus]